jgi:hypothetical protein
MYLSSLLFLLIFSVASLAQEIKVQNGNWLLGVLFKLEYMKDKSIEDIQKYEIYIQKSENTISKSNYIVRLAQQKDNVQAEIIAREALLKAQDAKTINQDKKNSAEFNKKMIENAILAVKNEFSNALSHPRMIKSVITNYSGRVSIQKKNGKIIDFGKNQTSLLKNGDVIQTYENSSAELQFLDGRGSLKVGENSLVKMQEEDAGTVVMNIIKGKVNISVEKVENYQKLIEEKIKEYGEDLKILKDATKQEKFKAYKNYLKELALLTRSKYEVRTPTYVLAIRGTEFLVFENDKTGMKLIVLEGSVEMRGIKEEKIIIVNAGYRASITKDGVLSEIENIDLLKIDRWWER